MSLLKFLKSGELVTTELHKSWLISLQRSKLKNLLQPFCNFKNRLFHLRILKRSFSGSWILMKIKTLASCMNSSTKIAMASSTFNSLLPPLGSMMGINKWLRYYKSCYKKDTFTRRWRIKNTFYRYQNSRCSTKVKPKMPFDSYQPLSFELITSFTLMKQILINDILFLLFLFCMIKIHVLF